MTFQPSVSLTEQIAQYLGHQIVIGQLKAGDRIQELRIAGELNVSRGSVREALLILERRHLIQILARRGAVVAEMTESEVNSLYELWFMLLEKVARNAARTWKDDDLQEFLRLIALMGEYADQNDVEKFYVTTVEFAQEINRFAHNSFMIQVLDDLLPSAKRAAYIVFNSGQSQLKKLHEFFLQIMELMYRRDADGAAEMVVELGKQQCEHVLNAIKHMKAHPS